MTTKNNNGDGRRTLTYQEWIDEARQRFGKNSNDWSFVCPVCDYVATGKDWRDAGAATAIGFSCIGRYLDDEPRKAFEETGKGPCNYAGGGLFKLNPVTVVGGPKGYADDKETQMFEFSD